MPERKNESFARCRGYREPKLSSLQLTCQQVPHSLDLERVELEGELCQRPPQPTLQLSVGAFQAVGRGAVLAQKLRHLLGVQGLPRVYAGRYTEGASSRGTVFA
jgi:hypothetical protein